MSDITYWIWMVIDTIAAQLLDSRQWLTCSDVFKWAMASKKQAPKQMPKQVSFEDG